VTFCPEGLTVYKDSENHANLDNLRYGNNNYFYTKSRAQEVADKINLLLKLERLHDTFCPDYVPNWNSNERKYFVLYDNISKRYRGNALTATEYKTNVFFATAIIAQKVCDILNAEQEEKQNEAENIT
jgi:hypothetical protein